MAVANGGFPFTQRDVVTEIYGDSSNRSLTELFSAATGTFDPAYVGSKNSLYNFRNYQHTTYPYPIASYYAITINGVFSSFYASRALAEQALYDYFHPAGRSISMNGLTIYWNTPSINIGSICSDNSFIDRWYIKTDLHNIYHIVNRVVTEIIYIA